MAVYEIPLNPAPRAFAIQFPNGVTYNLRLIYIFAPNDCWELDIADALGNPMVCGIPLVTGADLLSQFSYLGFGCAMFCTTDGDASAVPRFYNLGKTAHVWLVA